MFGIITTQLTGRSAILSKVYAPALFSLDGRLIEIECDMANGLPGFVVVGLADKAVE